MLCQIPYCLAVQNFAPLKVIYVLEGLFYSPQYASCRRTHKTFCQKFLSKMCVAVRNFCSEFLLLPPSLLLCCRCRCLVASRRVASRSPYLYVARLVVVCSVFSRLSRVWLSCRCGCLSILKLLYYNIFVDVVVVVDVLAHRDCRSLSNRVPLSCPLCSSE